MRADRAPRLSLSGLAREFGRRFWFGAVHLHGHKAFTAVREAGEDGPGLYAVITEDLAEMERALREDRDSRPSGPGLP